MNAKNLAVKARIEEDLEVFTALRRSSIAHQLKARMLQKDLKNVDVAGRLGVSEANVSRWFSGTQNLSLDTLYAISDALEETLTVSLKSCDEHWNLLKLDSEEEQEWEVPPTRDDRSFDLSCYVPLISVLISEKYEGTLSSQSTSKSPGAINSSKEKSS